MKFSIILIALLSASLSHCVAQKNGSWEKWAWLTGTWQGEGYGQPGKGSGSFTFAPDLANKILVRKSHSEFPPTNDRPATAHDDLMIVYPDMGEGTKAIYFDNEGHTINYSIAYADKAIVLTSDKAPNIPLFRLTYTLLDNGQVNTKFEMSQDGETFKTYVEGKSNKVK